MTTLRNSRADKEWPTFLVGPILEYYGGDLPMEDRGWRPYKCPFHGDRTASSSVNTILNVFVCHTCDMKGNAVQLIMKKEQIPYGDALKRAQEISGRTDQGVDGSDYSGRASRRSGSRAFKRTWKR